MYEPGTLRPPTAAGMARRVLPLEHVKIEHSVLCFPPDDPADYHFPEAGYKCRAHLHVDDSHGYSVADLIALCRDYGIPYDAAVVSNGYEGETALDWTHLLQCADCDGWHQVGETEAHRAGEYHAAVVFSRSLPPRALTPEQLAALGRLSDVHTAHCCSRCGCKYGSPDCTVEKGAPQEFPCEFCEEDEKSAGEQVAVIVGSIAAWLEKVADAHEARQRNAGSPGWSAEDVRAHHYRDAARGIRAGEWRK